MSSSLGFKLSVAGGGTAATASAAAGGLYLSSGDSPIIDDSSAVKKAESQPKQSTENLETKEPSPRRNLEQKQTPRITPVRNVYSKASEGSDLSPDTIGGRYYFFLAGTTIDQGVDAGTKASYIEWWKQKFELWQQETNTGHLDVNFQGITQGYDDQDSKALNKVCEEVYKQNDPFKSGSNENTRRTIENIEYNFWKYCSDLNEKPLNLVEAGESNFDDNSPIGHYFWYGYALAATQTAKNDKFWQLKQEWYESLSEQDTNLTSYVDTYVPSAKSDQKISLRKVCETAKSLNGYSGQGNFTPQLIVKYCGFSEHLYKPSSPSR